jgi:hypothetical protein
MGCAGGHRDPGRRDVGCELDASRPCRVRGFTVGSAEGNRRMSGPTSIARTLARKRTAGSAHDSAAALSRQEDGRRGHPVVGGQMRSVERWKDAQGSRVLREPSRRRRTTWSVIQNETPGHMRPNVSSGCIRRTKRVKRALNPRLCGRDKRATVARCLLARSRPGAGALDLPQLSNSLVPACALGLISLSRPRRTPVPE